MNLSDLLKIDLDDPNATNRELSLKLAVILRAIAVLVILFAIFRKLVA